MGEKELPSGKKDLPLRKKDLPLRELWLSQGGKELWFSQGGKGLRLPKGGKKLGQRLPSPSLPSPLLLLPSLPSPFIKEELWLLSGERELELLPWKPLVEEGETRGRRTVTLLRG